MEEKSFGRKFLIIALTIIAFFVLIYLLELISKPSLMLYSKIKSNIVVEQIKSFFTDSEKEQVNWNYLKKDIYALESGINTSNDKEPSQNELNRNYMIISDRSTGAISITVLGKLVYNETSYFGINGISRLIFSIVLLILAILIFITLVKISVVYFIKNEKDKSIIMRLIIYCIMYVIVPVTVSNLYNNIHSFYSLNVY